MRGEREFFGGESLEEYGKKLEKKNDVVEFTPWGELMTNVGEQMNKVIGSLEKERELSADIRKMGGKVTRETSDKIMDLERQKNDLLKVYEDVLEPVRKDADEAFLERADYLVPKPDALEALMTDPDEMEVTDDMLIEVQTSEELAQKETELRDEADRINEQMVVIIERMNKMKNEPEPLIPTKLAADMKEKAIDFLQSHFDDLWKDVVAINDKLKDVRVNLAFAKKMEDREDQKAA